jgi:catechol 2,3-dioxygenase
MKIPDNTIIQSIDLAVSDLDKSLDFYSRLIGFKEISRERRTVYLSADGKQPYIISLIENKNAKHPMRKNTGLYHIAVRFPNRKELAKVFLRLFENKVKFQGFSDHIVSEAVYLADPDGNGVELYADKPKDMWKWKLGQVEMDTLPLNLQVLTNELEDNEAITDGVHPGTKIGHIHLKVSDLFKAEKFYNHLLGFNVTNSSYPGALFLSAGGYHHHIGTNVWSSKNGTPPPENSLGLKSFTINIPDGTYINEIEEKAKSSGVETAKPDNGKILLHDFDNNKIILTL